ncbi:MAG: nitrite reductase/ring-hydroxylating ferredoxin subunit, partial [Saprospiraceae bacterium]
VCLGACTKQSDVLPSGSVDFTLDLNDPAYSKLATDGGYIIKNNVVVARDNLGRYVAATERCSHEGTYAIILKNNEWFCTDHDARFAINGNGLNEKGKRNLTIYQTEITNTLLRVFS